MIDFHNHIIPNLDDGPKSMDVAINMAKTAQQQGIKKIINTVHFNHPKMIGKEINYKIVERRSGDPDKLYSLSNNILNYKNKYSDLDTIISSMWDIYRK